MNEEKKGLWLQLTEQNISVVILSIINLSISGISHELKYMYSICRCCWNVFKGKFTLGKYKSSIFSLSYFPSWTSRYICGILYFKLNGIKGPSWSWSYRSWIYNYLCNKCLSPQTLWVRIPLRWCVLDTTLCDKVCKWLAAGRWFSPGTRISSTNKIDRQDITEILLKVALNIKTITLKPNCENI